MMTIQQLKDAQAAAESMPALLKRLEKEVGGWNDRENCDEELYAVVYEVRCCHEKVASEARWLQRKAEEVLTRIDRANLGYSGLNSLGELQGNGTSFDIAVALYAKAHERLNNLIGRRMRKELEARYQGVLGSLTNAEKIVFEVLQREERTWKQLIAHTRIGAVVVSEAITRLELLCLVTRFTLRGTVAYRANDIDRWNDACEADRKAEAEQQAAVVAAERGQS